jgi:flagellar L-ring protein precursor FlgH
MARKLAALTLLALFGLSLAGCNSAQRISEIGRPPALAPIENPTQTAGYQPVSLPMPQPELTRSEPNSLWRSGARGFFKDQRAKELGDILTVIIDLDEKAELSNETERTRDNSESAGLPAFGGMENQLGRFFPDGFDPANLVDGSSASSSTGTGAITRSEKVEVRVAALITDILPNGNLVIQGRQQVRVNYELRELTVSGVIRPEDIAPDNTVAHDQIAEARISYGGRGQIMDVQQPRYGQQLFDIVAPF